MMYGGKITLLNKETVIDVTGGSVSFTPTTGAGQHDLGGTGGLVLRRGENGTGMLNSSN